MKTVALLLAFVLALSFPEALSAQRRQQTLLSVEEAFGIAVSRLDPCERAIWSCCQSDRATFVVPSDCFEANGCFGLHWIGHRACAAPMLNAVGQQIQREMTATLRAAAASSSVGSRRRNNSGFPK